MTETDPQAGERYHRSVLASPESVGELRSEVAAYAQAAGASAHICDAVRLAVSEAVTNAVVHAYAGHTPGPVSVEAWTDDNGTLRVRVSDEGVGMLPRPDSRGMGMGLSLTTQMAATLQVAARRDRPGTMVSLQFLLAG